MRRFVTDLTAEECAARCQESAGEFGQTPRPIRRLLGGIRGRTRRDDCVYDLFGRPGWLGMRWYGLTLRLRLVPAPGGTAIDVVDYVNPAIVLASFFPFTVGLPGFLALALSHPALRDSFPPAGRWALVALTVALAALLSRGKRRADVRRMEERDAVGQWVTSTFDAVEVPPPQQGSDGSAGAAAAPDGAP